MIFFERQTISPTSIENFCLEVVDISANAGSCKRQKSTQKFLYSLIALLSNGSVSFAELQLTTTSP